MRFFSGNEWYWRLLRTIAQGVLGVIIANIDLIFAQFSLPPEIKAVIVAVVMAVLSPIMAEIGKADAVKAEE